MMKNTNKGGGKSPIVTGNNDKPAQKPVKTAPKTPALKSKKAK
jgi:hypothetical protein